MTSIGFSMLRKRFGDITATSIDSLHIESGQIVCFVGPSGCGKTTALRMIAGLVRQDSGDIRFGDRLVNDLPPERRNAAMVFQNYALFPHMTVFDNVGFGLAVRRRPRDVIAERVQAALELVQLPDVGQRYPRQLSGGQQQRIAVARALATEPDILLFDEPLSNLDAKLREYMRFELRQLLEKLHVTTVYVTHDQTEAMVVGDRMIVMNHGEVVQDGTPSEIYRWPTNRFVADFIGTASFISGQLGASNADGLLRLDTDDGLSFWGQGKLASGAPAFACIRPEAIHFVSEASSGDGNELNRFSTTVAKATDLGETTEVHLILGAWTLRCRAPVLRPLAAGDKVTIEITPDRCSIVAP
jgi:ABC-type Fe3+/spermidine/putrescine transport system ATPase subunit